jgi:hypothetical protein
MYNLITKNKDNFHSFFTKLNDKPAFFDNHDMNFYKQYLLDMINNLHFLNNIPNGKLFQDTDSLNNYLVILNELKFIKKELDINLKSIIMRKLDYENVLESLLLKYTNHIAPENMNNLFLLLFGNDWEKYFTKSSMEQLHFIMQFVRPISAWDSSYHKEDIPFLEIKKCIEDSKKPDDNEENKNQLINIIDAKNISSLFKSIHGIIDNNLHSSMQNNLHNKLSKRTYKFNEEDVLEILSVDDIKIFKNNKSTSLLEDKYGLLIYIKTNTKCIVIQGLVKDDILNISYNYSLIKEKLVIFKKLLNYNIVSIPNNFKENYLKILNLRDLIVLPKSGDIMEIIDDIKKKYNEFKLIIAKPLLSLINDFILASKHRKIDILTLLLMSNEEDQKIAYILYDVFKTKDKKNVASEIYNLLHYSIRDLLDSSKVKVDMEEQELLKLTLNDISYEKRISLMKCNEDIKAKAMEKLKAIKSNSQGDAKAEHWLDGLLKIPFGNYSENNIIQFKDNFKNKINSNLPSNSKQLFSDNDIDNYIKSISNNNKSENELELINNWNKYKIDRINYINEIRNTLDSAVYGHKEAKIQLERLFAQWINGENKGAVIGLMGPPGTGKTSLAKNGLSKCLKDINNNPRPFAFLPIGGSVNGSTLVGHNYTYVSSTWGRIADILMTGGCMNPIIFIDEVDKISQTEQGREIVSILTHLTDSTQNDEFEDKFFNGIKLDLSKALIIFSFNDISLLDPILRDRITIVEYNPLTMAEKLVIIKEYILPEICKEVGFNKDEIIFTDDIITYLIESYTYEAGVRKIKEKIVEIVRDINLNRFNINNNLYNLPFTVTQKYVEILFENKAKLKIKKISLEPTVGLVNGLYATSSGIGGITLIQLIKFPSDKNLDLMLTGKAGDMMKESVQYALKVAWGLLPKKIQNKITKDGHNKKGFGIHIHCPDAATPKDGPSAGVAFTLALYSLMMNLKINNTICMTGEVDLLGNITAIGGLSSKLLGGKKAGCKLALIPEENVDDLEKLRREKISQEDNTFKVIPVKHINEVIKLSIIK